MKEAIIRSFCLDEDICEVAFIYDEESGKHFGDYPDFEESPRHTKSGWRWTTAMQDGCSHGISKFPDVQLCNDCGSYKFFKKEQPDDLIGICENSNMRKLV